MKIIPVLDLLDGVIVRGVAGDRGRYQPVASCLTDSTDAIDVARALRVKFGFEELYLADLDGIMRGELNSAVVEELQRDGFRVMVDAGCRSVEQAQRLFECGADAVIVGLETLPGFDLLGELTEKFGSECVLFSLDLKQGQPWTNDASLQAADPIQLVDLARARGIGRLIVLDIAGVGGSAGVQTLSLCREINHQYPELKLITGGGIGGRDDLLQAAGAPVEGLLIASALHSGAIGLDDLPI